jgi:iron complex outermembrane receptor protein
MKTTTAPLLAFAAVCASLPLRAQTAPASPPMPAGPALRLDDYLVETNRATFDQKAPAVTVQILADDMRAVNLSTPEDALKNLPNFYVRRRFIGDKNAIVGIRGTSMRQTGRTVVLADGVLLSNFLATGLGNSPRWFLLAPEEIAKIAVIYGPFSALYPGNSIGGTILFSTAMPTERTATVRAQYFTQDFRQYGTSDALHGSAAYLSFGDRVGKFSYHAFYRHLANESQAQSYSNVLASATTAPGAAGATVTTGAFTDLDPSNRPRILYGSQGPVEAIHDLFKFKLGYDLTPTLTLRYTVACWRNEENRHAPESYLRDATGARVWTGRVEAAGRTFTIAPTQFSYSRRDQADLVNALVLASDPTEGLHFTLVGNLYDVMQDKQRTSTTAVPAALAGGAGSATVVGRTGWAAFDFKLGYRAFSGPLASHAPAVGWHYDRYFTGSEQFSLSNWLDLGSRTGLTNGNGGRTATHAFYAQDVWSFAPGWQLTPGLRWESWRASAGYRSRDVTAAGATTRLRTPYAERSGADFSPKLALAWRPAPAWSARLSLAEAYRYPTVGELFQGTISTTGSITNNDPDLRQERALTKDLTVEHTTAGGLLRLSLFEEDVRRAILNQTSLLPDGTSLSANTNVGKILARGVEVAATRRRFLHDSLEVNVAVSYTDARIRENAKLLGSEGKQVPRIPYLQTRAGLSWHATPWLTASAQFRSAGHSFNTLDHTDPRGGFGGADNYEVADAKLAFRLARGVTLSLGCDNLTDRRYFFFEPQQNRIVHAEAAWRF